MEPIFTIPYSEHQVIEQMTKHLKKKAGYSIYIPTSRQQKGIDFIIHNMKTNKFARVQVKGSRSYSEDGKHYLWYNNFIDKYKPNNADLYMLFGLYATYENKQKIKNGRFWKPITLCFTEGEMFNFLQQVRTKKEQKPDRFFAFGFTKPSDVKCLRGPVDYDVQSRLLTNMIDDIKIFLS